VEHHCPKEMEWKMNLYRGYINICHPEDHHLNVIDRLVEISSGLAIKEWKRLPSIVSHIHVSLLQVSGGRGMGGEARGVGVGSSEREISSGQVITSACLPSCRTSSSGQCNGEF
jgi:hypothetical protein